MPIKLTATLRKILYQSLVGRNPPSVPSPLHRTKRIHHAPTESDPELAGHWEKLQKEYFPERTDLLGYVVVWSTRRQKRVLASILLKKRVVRVAKELQRDEYTQWLAPVLYHEMCHAVLGVELAKRNGKIPWHGREFKDLVHRHPMTKSLDTWIHSGGWSEAVRRRRRTQHKIADL